MGFQCGAPAANQNAIPVMIPVVGTRQRQGTLGKGKLRSPVGGTIYANVIWPGMKWCNPGFKVTVYLKVEYLKNGAF